MTLKRVGSLKNKKHKHCLQCGRVLVGLKDNTEHECSFCGQKHFVDIYGDSDRTKRLGNDYRYRRYRGYERIPGLYTYFRHVPV